LSARSRQAKLPGTLVGTGAGSPIGTGSPPWPSTRPRILHGLGHQLVMLGPDVQPAADLLEDLGGIPSRAGRVVQPTGEAMAAGLGQVGGQAERATIDDGFDDVHG
jgi:hypothetical protein